MRGGLVAGGIVMVFLGFSWWYVLSAVGQLAPGVNVGILDALWLVCVVPIVLMVIGSMVFIAGLVGKSQAELDAMRAVGPQVVYVQAPPPQQGWRPPPPPP